MTLDEIRELLKLVMDSGVAEIELQRGQNRVRIRRTGAEPDRDTEIRVPAQPREPEAAPAAAAPAAPKPAAVAPAPAAAPAEAADAEDDPNIEVVKSPIVGTFYASPSPGAANFVKVGDTVKPGQVLCIIESMKLMNEIESEVGGQIVKELVSNAQPVEYGQGLFLIRKS